MLIATTDLEIIWAGSRAASVYQLRLHNPTWEQEHGCLFALKARFDVNFDEDKYLFASMGPGASKFQAVSLAFDGIRRKLKKAFEESKARAVRFAGTQEEFEYNGTEEAAVIGIKHESYTVRPKRRIKTKIARERLIPFRGEDESTQLDLILGQPYLSDGVWWCPFQIHPRDPKIVSGEDSYRAFRNAYYLIGKWFCDNFDDSWSIKYVEHGKSKVQDFAECREILFGGCMPNIPSVLIERALRRKGFTMTQIDEYLSKMRDEAGDDSV